MSPHRRVARVALLGGWLCLPLLAGGCGHGRDAGHQSPPLSDPLAARGERLVEERGCLSCHSTNGSRGPGPTWKDLAGSRVNLSDGRTVVADDEYLVRHIVDPDAMTVAGFPKGLMSSVIRPGSVTETDARAIVAYLKTLR